MATSPLFGWEEPDDTDLVKDGAAAIRTLGNAIDTSMGDLLGGTTGQVLSKASNTNMDFTWVVPGDITAVTATSPLTGGGTTGALTIGIQDATTSVKGAVQLTDSVSSTSTTTAATPNSVKTVNDRVSSNFTLLNTGGTALTGSSTITVSSISGYKNYFIRIDEASSANGSANMSIRFNADSGTKYQHTYFTTNGTATSASSQAANTSFFIGTQSSDASGYIQAYLQISGGDKDGLKPVNFVSQANISGNSRIGIGQTSVAAITSVSIISSSGSFDGGTIYVYGG